LEQLQRQVLAANEERDALKIDYRELQQEHGALEAQHASLKSDCTDLESQRNRAQRLFADLQKKYEASVAEAQQWRENCKKAQADASSARKDREIQDEAMKELAEREKEFERRAHANKLAVSVHSYQQDCH